MAIDTRDRRASCINFDLPCGRVYPNPDGSLASQADRQHMAGKYPGILAGAAAEGQPIMRRWGGVPGMLGAGIIGRSW
ncbi:MAG: hypothetical protein ACREJC_21620 [Tepidisphaeraceae bacterium]